MEDAALTPASIAGAPDTDDLIACPKCDALYVVHVPKPGERAVCTRCHHVLIAPRAGAVVRVATLSLTVLILLVGAAFFPFLEIRVQGFRNASSVFDAALAFSGPRMVGLSIAVAALIILIPMLRAMLTLYVVTPIIADRTPFPGAARCFRLAEELRPWSMAEIFVIGVGVALVKVADLARIEFGPAFWMFGALVVLTVFQDVSMCRWTIWHELDSRARRAGTHLT
ncbi:paraquat-inducible protein A [Tropicimonas sp. IMCC34011]|uniref:paraquat-inducible protein A n=1 Tax=Tropicimonas sp. IMCC34011 TaxID=2248759 RepID=UPI000E234C30|nr:paraquat-inducible protein A [Tropicimonas sp. IMCC34011]